MKCDGSTPFILLASLFVWVPGSPVHSWESSMGWASLSQGNSRWRVWRSAAPSETGLCRGCRPGLPFADYTAQATGSTEEPPPPPTSPGPWSTSRAPVLSPVFQGPRFMTSEYNSKYLKEPSNQPGSTCLSSCLPPTTLPSPWPQGETRGWGADGAGVAQRRHPRKKEGYRGSLGDLCLSADP